LKNLRDTILEYINIPLNGGINPVDNSGFIRMTTANQRAIGNPNNPGGSDSTISLNISLINISRTPPIYPNKYDLMAVVSNEIDEALGTSSGINRANAAPVDLFRYTAGGLRSYTISGDDAWFSINGGLTDLVRYNQNAGGDYGDWWSTGAHTARVQDAFGTAGAQPNLGVELNGPRSSARTELIVRISSPSPPLAGPAWSEERVGERRQLRKRTTSTHF
jgi:hypothetical protein